MAIMPQEVSDLDLVFPTRYRELLPRWEEIPEEFRDMNNRSKWMRLISDWFYCGLKSLRGKPKAGIDPQKAFRHIEACLRDWGPKHEHKFAGCAYLLSLWFEDVQWEKAKG